ncbi:MAG: DUF481 domain-containing protein [Pseudomonadota bacterium]
MKKYTLFTIIIFITLCVTQLTHADRIVYKEGHSVSGTNLSLENGKFTLEVSPEKTIMVDTADILAIDTDEPVKIIFKNNDALTGRIVIGQDNKLNILTEKFGEINNIRLKEIHEIETLTSNTSLSAQNKQDEVILYSGDRLLGKIKEIDEKNLIISTSFSDKDLNIPRDKIATITTSHPLTVMFSDNDYISGEIQPTNDGDWAVIDEQTDQKRIFSFSNVQEVIQGDPKQKLIEEQKFKYSGNVNIGIELESGNTDEDTYSFSTNLRARNPDHRFTFRGNKLYEKTDGERTEDETFASLKYDYFYSEKWFMFASTSFEQDRIDFLKLRSSYAVGVGYQFYETKDLFLSVDAGPAYVIEDFDNQSDNDFASMRWGVDFEYQVASWARFYHFHDGLFGLEDTNDTIITSQTGLRFPIAKNFNITAQANIDWEKDPPPDVSTTDKEYLLTLGYSF